MLILIRPLLITLAILLCLQSCEQNKSSQNKNTPSAISIDSSGLQVKVIKSNEGWGYDIYKDGQHFIHQPHMPVVGGKIPFKNEATAIKVGEYVLNKIEQGIMPPSINKTELDSLLQAKN